MSSDLKGKVAFITGAAHGQGRASALGLAKEGTHIIGFDIAKPMAYPGYTMGSADELETLKTECEALGVSCLVFRGDVRDDAAITNAVNAAKEKFDRIDILFNNAGICAYGVVDEMPEEEWDAMIDIN